MKSSVGSHQLPAWFRAYATIRCDAYVLLGALLTAEPSTERITLVQNLTWEEDLPQSIDNALTELVDASRRCSAAGIANEYQRIFVGLGSGELVPYGSWYLEKKIQSRPLARIRSALGRLGVVKQTESFESEDHAGALCEIMALLNLPENAVSENDQAKFFADHIGPWMENFFLDLQKIKGADFYPKVGKLGQCFLKVENEYLSSMSGN
ncbi:MAG: TorD/DmsD family molecular chaperone [Desulforhopalus sp.]